VTIAVVSYQLKTYEFVKPPISTRHQHFLQVSLPHFRVCSPFRMVICHYQLPLRALQLSTSTYIFSYIITFRLHNRSMGYARLVCTQFFFLPRERFGSHIFPSPSGESLWKFLSALFITMALLVKETLMYFSYTYPPNLTHQGAFVITEILSSTLHANGYKNTTMPTKISSPTALKCIQKEKKIYNWSKIEMHKFTKESVCTVHSMCGPTKP
jgi:hypothetical protein